MISYIKKNFVSSKRTFVMILGRKQNKAKFLSLSSNLEIKLDLGSGPNKSYNGWTTVDFHGADIDWDLNLAIPMNDNSVAEIYSSHLLEHLEFDSIKRLLLEIHRILIPGGEFRVCLPNARLYLEAYFNKKYIKPTDEMYQPALMITNSWIDQVNYCAYMGGEHRYLFDEENILQLLIVSGFEQVQVDKFNSDYDEYLRSFDSLYVIAKKQS